MKTHPAMYWLEVGVTTDGEGAEAVAEALRPFAYNHSVVIEQLGDVSNPDPHALETAVTVKIYAPQKEDTPALRRRIEEILYHLGRLYPLPPPTFRRLQDEDWANAWKSHYHPFRVGQKIWLQPSWLANETRTDARPDDVVLTLDPGMAFGTGLHPTTQMCLQALENVVQVGQRILDIGTGSGILAIVAARLGAAQVLALDTDEVAVQTARRNAMLNGVAGQIQIESGSLSSVTNLVWDVALVNILAPVIESMLEKENLLAYVKEGGYLILSGIIDEQQAGVETAVARAGGKISQTLTFQDWVSFVVTK